MSTVIPGGTHAFVYDKRNMEEVFATLQNTITEARVSLGLETRKNKLEAGEMEEEVPISAFGRIPNQGGHGPGLVYLGFDVMRLLCFVCLLWVLWPTLGCC